MEKKLDGNYTRMPWDIEQDLKVGPHKAAAVRPPATHHENYPN